MLQLSPMSALLPFNRRVLVTDAKHMATQGINAYEDTFAQPDRQGADKEHRAAVNAFRSMGVQVEQIASPRECLDGVFTANWALTWNGKALMSRLPNLRQSEEPHADAALQNLGFATKRAGALFSGQGDALIISEGRVLMGSGYRTDPAAAKDIKKHLGLEPIIVRAKPKRHWLGFPLKNKNTMLWESYFYDIDIAVGVIKPDLLAVCFDALTDEGKAAIKKLKNVSIIPVDLREARDALACNLVSTGEEVVMVDNAPKLAADLKAAGMKLQLLPNTQLRRNGGGFRCISLSLYS